MTIDGTNISTYGLRVLSMKDYYSQPARKRILAEPGYLAKDIKHESGICNIVLYGEYTDLPAMYTGIENFKTKVKTVLEHTFILVGHGLTFTGVVAGGIKTEVIQKTVQLKFTITKTTAT
jgi:hypothetical protein